MIMKLNKVVVHKKVQSWCTKPYPGYPKGCPMYGKRATCPPEAPLLTEIAEAPFYLVLKPFNLVAQESKMKKRHPEWSSKMCRNPRYWQKGLMSRIIRDAKKFISSDNEILIERPEANGVNLFATCAHHGVFLSRNPRTVLWKMVMIGQKRR